MNVQTMTAAHFSTIIKNPKLTITAINNELTIIHLEFERSESVYCNFPTLTDLEICLKNYAELGIQTLPK